MLVVLLSHLNSHPTTASTKEIGQLQLETRMGILSTYRFSKIFVRHCVYFGFKAILVVEAIAAITIFYTKATAEGLVHFF